MTRLVVDWLAERARSHPAAEAVADARFRWTFAELEAIVAGIARALRAEGLEAGARVASLLADDAAGVATIHALRRLGAVHVALSRRAVTAEIGDQLQDARVDALIHDPGRADLAVAALTRRPGTALLGIAALLARAADAGVGPPADAPSAEAPLADLDAPATIVFTSGTTGYPKMAVLTNGNHAASADAWAAFLGPRPTDRWCACLPLSHVAGMGMVHRACRWGVPLEVHERFDPEAVVAAIERGVTHVSLVPVMLERVLDTLAGRPLPPTVRAVLLGGGPIPPDLVSRALDAGMPVVPSYGLSETASGIAALPPGEARRRPASAGQALPGAEIRIGSDADPLVPGRTGEILVRGPMVFAGYATPAVRLRDQAGPLRADRDLHPDVAAGPGGWFATGDVGSLDAAGYLTVADRRDDIVVSGGENVYPAEVEAVLGRHPAVADAAVVGVRDPRWGAVPVALVVLRAGAEASDDALAAHCARALARFKVPVGFHRVAGLPRSGSGKLLRRDVRALLERETAAGTAVPRP